MKFSTSKNELQSALQKLSKATPSRSTLPILNSVLIAVSEQETTIKSTDLEITVDKDQKHTFSNCAPLLDALWSPK